MGEDVEVNPKQQAAAQAKAEARRHMRIALQKLVDHAEDPQCGNAMRQVMDCMAYLAPRTVLG